MTTMELNLRKESLYDLIKDMDEERFSLVEKYIKKLCSTKKKKEETYPWAFDEEKLNSMIAEAEADFNNGNFCTQEILKDKLHNELASW